MYQINPAKTGLQNLVDLMNQTAQVQFQGNEFTPGAPTVYTPTDVGDTRNTNVHLTAIAGQGFKGNTDVQFWRLAIGHTRAGARTSYNITDADTLLTIKAAILASHNLATSDVVITGTKPTAGNTSTWHIAAITDSYLYTGTLDVTVTNISNLTVTADDVFPTDILPGFQPYAGV
jgi:hypothetical protein